MSHPVNPDHDQPERRRAGLFDIRSIIGFLLGIYGLILIVAGFFTPEDQIKRAVGVNVNVWAGIGLVIVAALFLLWARLRPTVVTEEVTQADERPPAAH